MEILKHIFASLAAAMAHVQNLFNTQKFRRDVDLVRSFVCKAGEKGAFQMILPKDGAFELLGYNIAHTLDGSTAPKLFLKFSNSGSGEAWSNDYLPIRCIATPGAPSSTRYGFRPFWRAISQDETIKIEYDATACANDISVDVVFYGKVYGQVKVTAGRVQGA